VDWSETLHRRCSSDLVQVIRVKHRHEVTVVAVSAHCRSVLERHTRRRRHRERRQTSVSGCRCQVDVVALKKNSAGTDGRRLERRLTELAAIISSGDEGSDGEEQTKGRCSSYRSDQNVDRQTPHEWLSVPSMPCGDVRTVHGHEATSVDRVEPADERRLPHVDAEHVFRLRCEMRGGERSHVRLD